METVEVRPIGRVDSPLRDRSAAPKQGFEVGPQAWLEFDSRVAEGLRDLRRAATSLCSPGFIGAIVRYWSCTPAMIRKRP